MIPSLHGLYGPHGQLPQPQPLPAPRHPCRHEQTVRLDARRRKEYSLYRYRRYVGWYIQW